MARSLGPNVILAETDCCTYSQTFSFVPLCQIRKGLSQSEPLNSDSAEDSVLIGLGEKTNEFKLLAQVFCEMEMSKTYKRTSNKSGSEFRPS